jgi:hypothetical protein
MSRCIACFVTRHLPTSHHHLATISGTLQDTTKDEGNSPDHDYAEFELERVFVVKRSHSLATLRDKASANREAGMQPQKALLEFDIDQPCPCPLWVKDAPKQERRHNEADVVLIGRAVTTKASDSQKVGTDDNVGDDTQVITCGNDPGQFTL